jgi:nitrogen-specific signal transduction histidine kinase
VTLRDSFPDLLLPVERPWREALAIYGRALRQFFKITAIAAIVCFLPFLWIITASHSATTSSFATEALLVLQSIFLAILAWHFARSKRTESEIAQALGRESAKRAEMAMELTALIGSLKALPAGAAQESVSQKKELIDRASFWTDLAASMSHEIQNPLVALKTFAQLLPERFDDADFRKDFTKIVTSEVDRLEKVIAQINSFSHPPELIMTPTDIGEPIRKALDIARTKFSAEGVHFDVSLPTDLPRVLGDEIALAEAFAALVTNAVEATSDRRHSRVKLRVEPIRQADQTEAIVVSVEDAGGGIHRDLVQRVFSPLVTTKQRGLGLGLPIAQRTILEHKGQLRIRSATKGTSVDVVLPALPKSPER